MKNIIFALSVISNIGFLYIFFSNPPMVFDNTKKNPKVNSAENIVKLSEPDYRTYYDRLESYNLSDSEIKTLLLNHIKKSLDSASSQTISQVSNYWKPSQTKKTQHRPTKEERYVQIKKIVLELYGNAAIDDPDFTNLFKPLNSRYPFLSAEKQVMLQKILQAQGAGMGNPTSLSSVGDHRKNSENFHKEQINKIQKLLTDEEFFEYQLRNSRLAHRMRNSNFHYNEQEFRQIFEILSEKQNSGTSPRALVVYDMTIQKLLGEDRYFSYLKSLDINYRLLSAITKRSQISIPKLETAYQVIVNYYHHTDNTDRKRPTDTDSLQEARQYRDSQLANILGTDIMHNIVMNLDHDPKKG